MFKIINASVASTIPNPAQRENVRAANPNGEQREPQIKK